MNKFVLGVLFAVVLEGILATSPTAPPPPKHEAEKCPDDPFKLPLDKAQRDGIASKIWHVTHVTTTFPPSVWQSSTGPKAISCQRIKITDTAEGRDLTLLYDDDKEGKKSPITHYNDDPVEGEITFRAVKTDFDNYLVVINCEQHFTYHRVLRILSRTKTVDQAIVDEIAGKLEEYGFPGQNLEKISQENCKH